MTQKHKKHLIRNAIEFVKLQLAGNILFWGTLGGTYVLKEWLHWRELPALATAALLAHVLFFLVNRNWVFDENGKNRKSNAQIVRFIIFMGLNYGINLALTEMWWVFFNVNVYWAQFLNGLFFTFWTYFGLKLWVFKPENTRHPALTYHPRRKKGATRGKRSTK